MEYLFREGTVEAVIEIVDTEKLKKQRETVLSGFTQALEELKNSKAENV